MTPNPQTRTQARSQERMEAQPAWRTERPNRRGAAKTASARLNQAQVEELLCQALETERGGARIYEEAIACAQDESLLEEWSKYLEETRDHERILLNVFQEMGLDPEKGSPGRSVVRSNGEALVNGMQRARGEGDAALAEIVAAECVVLAETKDHMNWQLIGMVSKHYEGEGADALQEAHEEVEDQEDQHLYHTMGYARELWFQALGLPARIPPPEEERKVKSEADAARLKQRRKREVGRTRTPGKAPRRRRAPKR